MKTTRLIIATIAVAVAALFEVEGQSPAVSGVTNLQMGSTEAVMRNMVSLVDSYAFIVYQSNTNGNIEFLNIASPEAKFESKEVFDSWFHCYLNIGLSNILSSSLGDKNGIYKVSFFAFNWDIRDTSVGYNKQFNLVFTNGTYIVPPEIGKGNVYFYQTVAYKYPGIRWAIMETFNATNGNLVNIRDSRFEPEQSIGGVNIANEVLVMPTAYITGKYKVRLHVVSGNGEYRVFNENGIMIPETPAVITYSRSGNSMIVQVTGGDPGRKLVLQKSSDFKVWSDVMFNIVGYYGHDLGMTHVEPVTSSKMFFRVIKQDYF